MRAILPLVLLCVCASCASVSPQPAGYRFQMVVTPYGLLRVDQQTGQTWAFHQGSWLPVKDLDMGLDTLFRLGAVQQ